MTWPSPAAGRRALPSSRCVELNDDVLKVDGSFAVARLGDIKFKVEKSTKSLLGSAASGEGLLQTFRGTGEVWLNPTEGLHGPNFV